MATMTDLACRFYHGFLISVAEDLNSTHDRFLAEIDVGYAVGSLALVANAFHMLKYTWH